MELEQPHPPLNGQPARTRLLATAKEEMMTMTQTATHPADLDAVRAALNTALVAIDQQAATPATLAAVANQRHEHEAAMKWIGRRPVGDPMTGDHSRYVQLAAAFGRVATAFEGADSEPGVRTDLALLAAHALAWLDTLNPDLNDDDEPPF